MKIVLKNVKYASIIYVLNALKYVQNAKKRICYYETYECALCKEQICSNCMEISIIPKTYYCYECF